MLRGGLTPGRTHLLHAARAETLGFAIRLQGRWLIGRQSVLLSSRGEDVVMSNALGTSQATDTSLIRVDRSEVLSCAFHHVVGGYLPDHAISLIENRPSGTVSPIAI